MMEESRPSPNESYLFDARQGMLLVSDELNYRRGAPTKKTTLKWILSP